MAKTKKVYITPTIEVRKMDAVSMLASSVHDGGVIGGNPDTPPSEQLSQRRRNYWNEIGEW